MTTGHGPRKVPTAGCDTHPPAGSVHVRMGEGQGGRHARRSEDGTVRTVLRSLTADEVRRRDSESRRSMWTGRRRVWRAQGGADGRVADNIAASGPPGAASEATLLSFHVPPTPPRGRLHETA